MKELIKMKKYLVLIIGFLFLVGCQKESTIQDYFDSLGNIYSLGATWGYDVASMYDSDALTEDGYPFKELMSKKEAEELAETLLDERVIDFLCFGADDCMDLPTDEELESEYYHIEDIPPGESVKSAFRSGYIDSFVDYFE